MHLIPLNVDEDAVNNQRPVTSQSQSSPNEISKDPPNIENLKVLLKNNFFLPILKNESDFPILWDAIDTTKLVHAMSNVIAQLQQYFCDKTKEVRAIVETKGETEESQHIELCQGVSEKDFPVLKHFCIPLENFWISGLLRDILKLSKSVVGGSSILKFKQYNDCEATLVPIPKISSYYRFERNMKEHPTPVV